MKLRTLISVWEHLNSSVFAGVLTRPRFLVTRNEREYASYQWAEKESIIYFNSRHIRGFRHALAIVFHEMVHQYVEEYLGIEEEDHHGDEFWRNHRIFNPGLTMEEIV
jgi:hypothetical protein